MRAVVQIVKSASVEVGGETVGEIGPGVLLYVAVEADDDPVAARTWGSRFLDLRVLPDSIGRPTSSLRETPLPLLLISSFTLAATFKSGRKPSLSGSARAQEAEPVIKELVATFLESGTEVQQGVFGAEMIVHSSNWGPTTFIFGAD